MNNAARRAPRRRFRSHLKGPLILFGIVAGMFWKLIFTRQYTWLNSPDVAGLVLPWFQLEAANLHRWSLALWDPYQWCGQPIAAEGQAGVLYPLNWLLWALPLHRTWIRHVYLNWYFVLIHFQGALFAYWLCRDQGKSRAASLAGGMVFAFGPFFGTSIWPAALNGLAWAPLQLLFFLRAKRGVRPLFSAAACGAALGIAWLSGSDEIPMALSLAFMALWIWQAIRARSWAQPAIAAAAMFGMGAMQIFPAIQFLPFRPHIWTAQADAIWRANTVGPIGLVNLILPRAGDPALFIGCAVFAFAAVGVWKYSGQFPIRMCLWLGVAGLALAAGPWTMFGGALYGLRLIWKDPHSALVLLALALPIPVAAGIDALRDGVRSPVASRILLTIAALCGAMLFVLALVAGDNLDRLSPPALCGVGALLAFALLEARGRRAISARAAAVCAILLAMWQFGHVLGMDWRNIEFGWPYLDRLAASSDIADLLRSQSNGARIANPDRSAGFQLGDWEGVEQFDGLTGGTENIVGVADLPTARALAGTEFLLAAKPTGEQVFQSVSGMKAYSSPNPFPRAWVVNNVFGVASRAETRANLSRPASEFRRRAFVTGQAPRLVPCPDPGIANWISRRGRTLMVHAALPCNGLVVISQTFYPGWSALVDGKPAGLFETDGFLTGVLTPAGEHTIELIYQPWSILIGGAISTVTAILLIVVYKRRDNSNPVADPR